MDLKIKLPFSGKVYIVEIDKAHYVRRLGMPKDHDLSEHIENSMKWASEWYAINGNPWLHIYELDVRLQNEKIYLNGHLAKTPKVYKRFEKYGAKKAMLIAATARKKVDNEIKKLWSSDFPDHSFFLDIYAACVTEAIVAFSVNKIKEWAQQKQMNVLSRYSPGYPGWDLKEQIVLMNIISDVAKETIPITVSETALLNPLKSQLSLVGIYKGKNIEKKFAAGCLQCTFNNCNCQEKGTFVRNKNI